MSSAFPQASYVNLAGWLHLVIFGLLLPALVLRNARAFAQGTLPLPPRMVHFKSTTVILLLCLAISLSTMMSHRLQLFPPEVPHLWRGVAAGLVFYVAAVAVMRGRWRQAIAKRMRVLHFFIAENRTERIWWIAISVIAGISEEITWRGVQTALLVPLTGSYWIAAALSAVSFALAHAIQGWKSAAGIFVFALAFQGVVVASGSLYVAIVVHIAYDITAGMTYSRLAREMGYVPELT